MSPTKDAAAEPSALPDPHAEAGPQGHPPGYIPTLDGWRAIAILWVMLFHGGEELFGPSGVLPSATLYRAVQAGPTGVDIFFAISGFLICSRLLAEREKTGRIDLRRFYLRRSFRILPASTAYLVVVGLLGCAGVIPLGRREVPACLMFFRNYLPPAEDGEYTRHFWSLSVEEHFYLLWPGLIVLFATAPRARRAALAIGLAVLAWRWADTRWRVFEHLFGPHVPPKYMRTDRRLDGLIFGCWVALLVAEPAWWARLTRRLSSPVWLAMVAALLAIVCGRGVPALARLAVPVLIPLILAGTVLRPELPAGRMLEWGPLRWVGRLSYSLYLWQQLFLIGRKGNRPLGWLQALPLDWLAALACALASHHLIERPMIAAGRRLAARRKVRSGPVESPPP